MKGFMKTTPAPQEKKAKTKIPAYDPEEDALYDFTEEEAVNEDDLFDLDELESIKLDNEQTVCNKNKSEENVVLDRSAKVQILLKSEVSMYL